MTFRKRERGTSIDNIKFLGITQGSILNWYKYIDRTRAKAKTAPNIIQIVAGKKMGKE